MKHSETASLRIIVVDGDPEFRRGLAARLPTHGFDLLATAISMRTGLPKIECHQPDAVVVDTVTPSVDGLELLEHLHTGGRVGRTVALVAEIRSETAARAQALGATPVKRPGTLDEASLEALSAAIHKGLGAPARPAPSPAPEPAKAPPRRTTGRIDVVGIGISTGGPKALATMLPLLPADLGVPVLVVQHMPPNFTHSLAESLARTCKMPVREARGGELVAAGTILIAPGGKQMKVVRMPEGVVVRTNEDPPENGCRPAVDYLFRSLRDVYGSATCAVVMTGMGEDGLAGCRQLGAVGAPILAQDEATSTVFGMPRGPITEGLAEATPLTEIAAKIVAIVKGGR